MKNRDTIKNYRERGTFLYQIQQANSLLNNNSILLAQKIISELVNEHPDDYGVMKLQAKLYVKTGMFEDAMKMYDMIPEEEIYWKKAVMYMLNNDYDNLIRIYKNYYENKEIEFYDNPTKLYVKYYAKTLLKEPITEEEYSSLSYTIKQLVDYSEERAISHIKEHHLFSEEMNREGKSFFKENIDIEELYYEIKKIVDDNIDKAKVSREATLVYIIYYPNLSLENSNMENCHTLRVCTKIGTNEILTIYPSNPGSLDVIYPKITESKKEIKKISQIEKFNKRYN